MKQIPAPSISPSFSPSTSIARVRPRTPMAVAFSLALASLSVLAGCPGSLEGDFPPPGNSTGSGGSSSGSGGMTGSGGSNMSGSGGSGSGGSGSGSGGSMAACDAPAMVFKPKCGTASCHDTFEPKVSGSDPWGTLLNKDSASSTCMGKFVNPAKPASGVLFQRLKDGNCGAQMPLLPPYLTSNEMDCVTSWVTSKLP